MNVRRLVGLGLALFPIVDSGNGSSEPSTKIDIARQQAPSWSKDDLIEYLKTL